MGKIKDRIKLIIDTKTFHISVIIIIIAILIFIGIKVIIQYNEQGETNMPFEISKINIVSSTIGENAQGESQTRWNIDVSQNNDIYIYIDKNKNYEKEEIIKSVIIDNFEIEKKTEIGTSKIYKPDSSSEKVLFKNVEENSVQSLEFTGATNSDIKNLQMSNQGDMIYFRYCNKNIANYSSDDEEINHSELLKKLSISEDTLETNLKFDLTMNLNSNKGLKTTINLKLPINGIVEKGTTTLEKTDLTDLIFKRVKN